MRAPAPLDAGDLEPPGTIALLALAAALACCGGSASETPFPQSPSEITSEPLLHRPPAPSATAPLGRPTGGRISGSPE